MSTTATLTERPPTPTRHLTLVVSDRSDVLARVICVCLRRGCDLREVLFRRASATGPATVELALVVGPRQAGSLHAWLGGLVDVRSVRE